MQYLGGSGRYLLAAQSGPKTKGPDSEELQIAMTWKSLFPGCPAASVSPPGARPMGNSMFRNTPVLIKRVLDTAFGLPGIILFGLLGGVAVGLAVGRSAVMDISLPEEPISDASLALAVDYGRGTTLLLGPLLSRADVADGSAVAKAGSCAVARNPSGRN
jgi:hypothetical protein